MTRRAAAAAALVAGIFIGALLTTVGSGPVAPGRATRATDLPPNAAVPAPPASVVANPSNVLLAWTSGGLPVDLDARLADDAQLSLSTVVAGGTADLRRTIDAAGHVVHEAPTGMTFPLDLIAVTPTAFAQFAPQSDIAPISALADGGALLSSTSAALRRLEPGGRLDVNGTSLTVAAVVSDESIGGAEAAVTASTGRTLGLTVSRYALVRYTTSRRDAEAAIARFLPGDVAIRFRAPGETPFLREGDAVAPLAQIKQRYGEFAYRPSTGRDIVQDPAWIEANIVDTKVPILGEIRCHREIVEPLRNALEDLAQRNLAPLVDPRSFAGCWNPRRVSDDDSRLSRHAWGIAVDLNWSKNPTGLHSVQDRRVVAAFAAQGFVWGGEWLVPDPAHFEHTP